MRPASPSPLALGCLMSLLLQGVSAGYNMDIEKLDIEKRDLEIEFSSPLAVRASGTNFQTFTGALGGAPADPITSNPSDPTHPFLVKGEGFPDLNSAFERSCANQHNTCANAANASGDGINNKSKNGSEGKKSTRATGGLTVGDCDAQQSACVAAQSSSTQTNTGSQILRSQDANFDYFCDS